LFAPFQKIPSTSTGKKVEAAKEKAAPTKNKISAGVLVAAQAAAKATMSNNIFDSKTRWPGPILGDITRNSVSCDNALDKVKSNPSAVDKAAVTRELAVIRELNHPNIVKLKEVIRAGSLQRLNAILMTALTSALGTLPLALAFGAGNEILQPLAIVVLGGLITSTLLTLLVLPALYARFGRWLLPRATAEA